MLSPVDYVWVTLAAVAAGAVNALAGGGTLITFPVLVAVGVPALTANVTNTVALCPGYLGATLAQRQDLEGQSLRIAILLPAAALGGLAGGLLLLHTEERVFRTLVPFLILLGSILLAIQDKVRNWIAKRPETNALIASSWPAFFPIALAGIYGGYFGAGLSVIVLAVLAILFHESLTRLNALKQAIALSANIAAAVLFLFSKRVLWDATLFMALGAFAGGAIGGRLAGKINPRFLRWIVVAIGAIVGLAYLFKI